MASPASFAKSISQLLEKNDQTKPPIDVLAIARGERAQVVHHALGSDVSGVLIRNDDRILLGVNSAHHPRRQRFTIAHELGHLVLHPGRPYTVDSPVRLNWRNDLSSLATDQEEIAANKFAAELLMPEGMIRSAVRALATPRVPNEDQILGRLAREFDVSVEAMSFRLINLGIRS
jgi:Zn-dependent peptidase ImmA (M78 family)